MNPTQEVTDYSKVDFSKSSYDQPDYKFPYDALAATVSAVAFAALYEFSYLVGAFAGPVGLAGFAVSVVVGYNLYQNNRGEAEFNFATGLETAFDKRQDATYQAIYWLKKAALRHYQDASIKAQFFQTSVNMKNQRGKHRKALDNEAVASHLETFLSRVSSHNITRYLKTYFEKIKDLCAGDSLCEGTFDDIMRYANTNSKQFPIIYKHLWPLVNFDD
jgi:hypothetical protein